jgi:hypothetical protein
MATNLAVDQDILERAAVTKALQELIARREQRHIADLFGKLEWDASFDYKAERLRRK